MKVLQSDKVLARRAALGDEAALSRIFKAHGLNIRSEVIGIVGNRYDWVEEIMQEIMIKVWRKIGTFKGEAKLSTWLYRVAANEAIMFARKEKKHANKDNIDAHEGYRCDKELPDRRYAMKEALSLFAREWEQMKFKTNQREACTLILLHDLDPEEAYEVMDLTIPAGKSALHRGRERIRARFPECIKQAVNF